MQVEFTQPSPTLVAQSLLQVSLNVLSNEVVIVEATVVELVELEMLDDELSPAIPNALKNMQILKTRNHINDVE